MDSEKRKARQARYAASEKGKAAAVRYENSDRRKAAVCSEKRKASKAAWERTDKAKQTRKKMRDAIARSRPIVAIDGEGLTEDGQHKYVLLCASDGSSFVNRDGISTKDAVSWLLELSAKHPGALFVSFGFGYDICKMLKDLRHEQIGQLRRTEFLRAGKYRFWWRSGKFFGVADESRSLTIWDIRSYFRGNFIAACKMFLGDVPDIITQGKASRAVFTWEELEAVKEYNQAELQLMVMVTESIRERLTSIGLRPGRFDGAGSIATSIMRSHNLLKHLPDPGENIRTLSQFAFIGGRVECLQYGNTNRGAYQYDMRSAYPWALTQLPSFQGRWHEVNGDAGAHQWALYQVAWWDWCHPFLASPLPYRTPTQKILFPSQGRALVWSPEVNYMREWCNGLLKYKIEKSWVFEPDDPHVRPFAFMADLYAKRQQLQADRDGAADILKIGMAAVWGKLAQRAGWTQEKLPKYHHLPAAGLATSLVRAAVYDMANADLDAVVAIETDAIVTRRRLNRPKAIGSELGQWKEIEYKALTYCNAGLAFAVDADGNEIAKTAGIPRGLITRDMILAAARQGEQTLPIQRNRFIGAAQCEMAQDWSDFGQWVTVTDHIRLAPWGKRMPYPKLGAQWSRFNPTVCVATPDEHGSAYELPWLLDGVDLQEYLRREFANTAINDMGDYA